MPHQFHPPKWHPSSEQRWERCPVCGKRGYPNRTVARERRRAQIRQYGEKVSDLSVYKCDSGMFHLGHPPGHHYVKESRDAG
jgi:hypothetical protein